MIELPFSDFVMFVAPFPKRENVVEGWMSRIRAVDEIFESRQRIYFNFSTQAATNEPPELNRHGAFAIEYIVNPNSDFHRQWIEAAILKCSLVYVQTVHLARYVLEYYPTGKFVTDFHGIVPEEETMMGSADAGLFYEGVERAVITGSRIIVVVTHAMKRHLQEKYDDCSCEFIVLPIIEKHEVDLSRRTSRVGRLPKIIYSGGTQVWQNIDMMVDLATNALVDAEFVFLSHDHSIIKDRMNSSGFQKSADYLVTTREKLAGYYLQADFGFVLRDDVAVNRVACPTKLSEYLQFGIIPIVKTHEIGDFAAEGYQFVTHDEFRDGVIPSSHHQQQMAQHNYSVIAKISSWFGVAAERLKRLRLPNMVKSGSLSGLAVAGRHLMFPARREIYVFGKEMSYFADWVVAPYSEHEVDCGVNSHGNIIRIVPMVNNFAGIIKSISITASDDQDGPIDVNIHSQATAGDQFDCFPITKPYLEASLSRPVTINKVAVELDIHGVGDSIWALTTRNKGDKPPKRHVRVKLTVNNNIVCDQDVKVVYVS